MSRKTASMLDISMCSSTSRQSKMSVGSLGFEENSCIAGSYPSTLTADGSSTQSTHQSPLASAIVGTELHICSFIRFRAVGSVLANLRRRLGCQTCCLLDEGQHSVALSCANDLVHHRPRLRIGFHWSAPRYGDPHAILSLMAELFENHVPCARTVAILIRLNG